MAMTARNAATWPTKDRRPISVRATRTRRASASARGDDARYWNPCAGLTHRRARAKIRHVDGVPLDRAAPHGCRRA
jgi:hypothetical protein